MAKFTMARATVIATHILADRKLRAQVLTRSNHSLVTYFCQSGPNF